MPVKSSFESQWGYHKQDAKSPRLHILTFIQTFALLRFNLRKVTVADFLLNELNSHLPPALQGSGMAGHAA